jgi:hypothetical protein
MSHFLADFPLDQQNAINRNRVANGLPPLRACNRVQPTTETYNLAPLGNFARGVQASAALKAVAEDLGVPVGGERRFEISIKDLQVPKPQEPTMPQQPSPRTEPRWTQPAEPQTLCSSFVQNLETSDFARSVTAAIADKLGHRRAKPKASPKSEPEPDPEPQTFAEKVAREIRRRRPGWRQPSN